MKVKAAVIPINDIYPHKEFSTDCSCDPTIKDEVLVHNSFDGREFIEKEFTKRNNDQDIKNNDPTTPQPPLTLNDPDWYDKLRQL